HASIGAPPGISSAEHPARVYPETREAGETPVGRALRSRPGAPEKRCAGAVCHLRAGLSNMLVWRPTWAGCPSSAGQLALSDLWPAGGMGSGGGSEELLWELESRMDAPFCRAPGGRPAPD